MSLAGSYFLREQAPVEDDGALPGFEACIERLAKATGPHLYGLLFVRHCRDLTSGAKAPSDSVCLEPGINPRPTARYSFSLALLNFGISLPLLKVSRPAAA